MSWKENKAFGIAAGVIGALLIIIAIASLIKRVSVTGAKGEAPLAETEEEEEY